MKPILSLLIACLVVSISLHAQTMKVHFINVGQGSATLVEFPCGAILIDVGGETNDQFTSGDTLTNYLDKFFLSRPDLHNTLDAIYLTHPHKDHTLNVQSVIDGYKIKNVITDGIELGRFSGLSQQKKLRKWAMDTEGTPDPSDDIGFQAVLNDDIGTSGLTNAIIDAIDCENIDPKITALWGQVTNPSSDWTLEDIEEANNHSVVLRIDFGTSSMIITGDLEDTVAIPELVAKYQGTDMLNTDVYLVRHHGSKNGTTQGLLTAMSPKMAVLAVGDPKREIAWTGWQYGHPNERIVNLIEASVTETRPAITVKVGKKGKLFKSKTITKAIYATGWDGSFVLEADSHGGWHKGAIGAQPALLSINLATKEQLEGLSGLGPVKADAIVAYRTSHGNFSALNDLDNVPGIGPATINALRPFITL